MAFDIDANGILHVSATDKGTGKEQKIRIEASSGLTDEEIEKMKKEAEANAEADKTEKEKIDKADNPALKFLIKNDLSEKNIVLKNVLVKDITESNNIDYEFCVITDIVSQKGSIEFYIYTKNINIISRLVKGKTRINAEGNFYRFFSILDKYYTKVEVTNSSINIVEKEK